jgi:predicted RNA-binding protein with PIN domain
MEYWVDGYNLILRKRWTDTMTLEQSRDRLLSAAAALANPVHVYFDASQSPGGGGRAPTSTPSTRVRAVFVRGEEADEAMITALRAAPRGTVTLVTDDRELRGRARQLGANTLGVDRFLEKLERAVSPVPPKPATKKGPVGDRGQLGLSKKQLDDWMNWFGFDPDEEPLP